MSNSATPLPPASQACCERILSTDEFTWRKALIELAVLEGKLPLEKVTEANICMAPWQGRGIQ